MSELKWCPGLKGDWYCEDDHPNHWVPESEFGFKSGQGDGLQSICRSCMSAHNYSQYRLRPKHPVTGEAKMNWKQKVAKTLGGSPSEPEWVSYLNEAESQWDIEIKAYLLNTASADAVLAHMKKSEFGQSKPMTKRTITKVEGEKVPEGWVYVVRNPDVPSIVKIGKTFPDGIPDIMSSARRFGRAELVAKYEFNEAYKAEQSIHKRLAKYNLRALGYTDCGKELFECDEMVAIFAILAEGPVLDDDEDVA